MSSPETPLDAVCPDREPYSVFTRDQISRAVLDSRPTPHPFDASSLQASVAIVVTDGKDCPEVCFIRRAERDDDPWSGHVSFPGGRAEPCDQSAEDVAERETREEIGMHLDAEHRIGPLTVLPKIRRGLTLFPFVYWVDSDKRAEARVCAKNEVARVFWVPLRHFQDEDAVTTLDYDLDGRRQTFPAIRYDDHVIWGLTLHLLHYFNGLLGQPFPALDGRQFP